MSGQLDIRRGSGPREGKIYAAIIEAMRNVRAVGKDQYNQQQKFRYRGIDDIYNACHEPMAKAGVFSVPHVLRTERSERPSRSGGVTFIIIMESEYEFIADDGSSLIVGPLVTEAMDSGDKAYNKALAIAHKYALIQMMALATGEPDPDGETHEIAPPEGRGQHTDNGRRGNKGAAPQQEQPPEPEPPPVLNVEDAKAVAEYLEKIRDAPDDAALAKIGANLTKASAAVKYHIRPVYRGRAAELRKAGKLSEADQKIADRRRVGIKEALAAKDAMALHAMAQLMGDDPEAVRRVIHPEWQAALEELETIQADADEAAAPH